MCWEYLDLHPSQSLDSKESLMLPSPIFPGFTFLVLAFPLSGQSQTTVSFMSFFRSLYITRRSSPQPDRAEAYFPTCLTTHIGRKVFLKSLFQGRYYTYHVRRNVGNTRFLLCSLLERSISKDAIWERFTLISFWENQSSPVASMTVFSVRNWWRLASIFSK